MPPSDSNAVLGAALRRFRRRLRLVAFVRYVPVASAIALGLVNVLVIARPDIGVDPAVWAGSLVLAIVSAYGLAVLRTPSLSATARIVDRQLGLQDRATSALEFSPATDAISRLVIEDAAARLRTVPVARLPLSVPVSARWLAASAVAASALILLWAPGSTSDSYFLSDSVSTTVARRTAAETAVRPEGSKAKPLMPGTVSVGNGGRRTARVSAAIPDVPPPQANNAAGHSAGSNTGRSDSTTSKGEARASQQAPLALPPPSRSSAASGLSGRSAGDGRARGEAGRGSSSMQTASGRGAGAAATKESAGGGVGGGALVSVKPGAAVSEPTTGHRQTADYALAYARAESAMPMEHVPPALRSYVRAYFLAIRPTARQ